ncbi:MAG TPA: DUF2868 domain-containing protein, partial [Nitrosomonas sp.]|nr:DUF2868 domain-containing protein [Nitrosomonas sp.]
MSVNKYKFADLVRIEQLRKIESSKAEELSYASIKEMSGQPVSDFNYSDFMRRLVTRANLL